MAYLVTSNHQDNLDDLTNQLDYLIKKGASNYNNRLKIYTSEDYERESFDLDIYMDDKEVQIFKDFPVDLVNALNTQSRITLFITESWDFEQYNPYHGFDTWHLGDEPEPRKVLALAKYLYCEICLYFIQTHNWNEQSKENVSSEWRDRQSEALTDYKLELTPSEKDIYTRHQYLEV